MFKPTYLIYKWDWIARTTSGWQYRGTPHSPEIWNLRLHIGWSFESLRGLSFILGWRVLNLLQRMETAYSKNCYQENIKYAEQLETIRMEKKLDWYRYKITKEVLMRHKTKQATWQSTDLNTNDFTTRFFFRSRVKIFSLFECLYDRDFILNVLKIVQFGKKKIQVNYRDIFWKTVVTVKIFRIHKQLSFVCTCYLLFLSIP